MLLPYLVISLQRTYWQSAQHRCTLFACPVITQLDRGEHHEAAPQFWIPRFDWHRHVVVRRLAVGTTWTRQKIRGERQNVGLPCYPDRRALLRGYRHSGSGHKWSRRRPARSSCIDDPSVRFERSAASGSTSGCTLKRICEGGYRPVGRNARMEGGHLNDAKLQRAIRRNMASGLP